MTDGDNAGHTAVLRADALGRVQRTREQREAILDEFERSALSGPKFAEVHGINYQTFATWRQRRKRERSEYPESEECDSAELTFLEVELPEAAVGSSDEEGALVIELPGGSRTQIRNREEVALAAELIKALR